MLGRAPTAELEVSGRCRPDFQPLSNPTPTTDQLSGGGRNAAEIGGLETKQ